MKKRAILMGCGNVGKAACCQGVSPKVNECQWSPTGTLFEG